MLHWLSLSVDPGTEVDRNQIISNAYLVAGLLIFTAILVFSWRFLNGQGKTFLIAVGLIIFVIAFVIPNWNS